MSEEKADKIANYIKSEKAFILEMPLYFKYDLSSFSNSIKIFTILKYQGTIDAYCVECKKDGIFRASEQNTSQFFTDLSKSAVSISGPIEITYECTRDSSHIYNTYFMIKDEIIQKVG